MAKFCLPLLCLLVLAGCSHAPKARQAEPFVAPIAEDSSSSEESHKTAFPLVEDPAALDPSTLEPDAAAKPDLPKALAAKQDTSRSEVFVPVVEASIAVEPHVSEPKLVDAATTRPDAVEREVIAPTVAKVVPAEADLPKPAIEKQKGEEMTVSKPDPARHDVEDSIGEPNVTNSPAEHTVAESVVEDTMLAERAPPEPELSETEGAEGKDTSHLIKTQLTVVSTTGTVLSFLSGDELKASVPLSAAANGNVLYEGAREIDLWKSPQGGDALTDSILEVVGTVTLSGDASSYMLLCAMAEVPIEGDTLQSVMLPDGLGHVSDNSMCFVNLTPWDLEVHLDELKFFIPPQSHYDLLIDNVRSNKVHILADVKPLHRASNQVVSEEVRNPSGEIVVFQPLGNPTAEPKAIRMQIISSFDRLQRRVAPKNKVIAEPQNSNNTAVPEKFLPLHPVMTPETRTY